MESIPNRSSSARSWGVSKTSEVLRGHEITEVTGGRIYVVWTERNAWNWSTSTKLLGSDWRVHADLASAKDACERMRIQGTVFTISERPCLVIRSGIESYVLSDIGNKPPLSQLEASPLGNTIRTFADPFVTIPEVLRLIKGACPKLRNSRNLVQRYFSADVDIQALGEVKPWTTSTSKSIGSLYRLTWKVSEIHLELGHIASAIKALRGPVAELSLQRAAWQAAARWKSAGVNV